MLCVHVHVDDDHTDAVDEEDSQDTDDKDASKSEWTLCH